MPKLYDRIIDIKLDRRPVTCRVYQNRNSRHVKLRIAHDTDLEVSVPPDFPINELEKIIREKSSWIEKHLERKERSRSPVIEENRQFSVMYRGNYYPLVFREGITGFDFQEGKLVMTHSYGRELTKKHLYILLSYWYRMQARRIIPEIVKKAGRSLDLEFNDIRIKDQKSRWGSCSGKKNLNFNWRLVIAPQPVLEYVVFHELFHLKELNHSPRFWSLVETACPDYRKNKLWLKTNGSGLLLFNR